MLKLVSWLEATLHLSSRCAEVGRITFFFVFFFEIAPIWMQNVDLFKVL